MKKVSGIMLISCIMLTMFACKKNSGDKSENNSLIGYWELAEASSAMMPARQYGPGNGKVIEITATTYKYYDNGQVIKSGIYTTMEDNTVEQNVCLIIEDDRYTRRIVFDTAFSATKSFYEIRNGKLALISGCYAYDAGHREEYRRVNKDLPQE